MTDVKVIPLSSIRVSEVKLRDVDHKSESFLGIVDSIKQKGILTAILVRPKTDADTGEQFYELVDGLQRYTASRINGLATIPAIIDEMSDFNVLEAQIAANIHKVETKPIEYTNQLRRMMKANTMLTVTELSSMLAKSPAWISQMLKLDAIEDENIQALINDGKIKLNNAFALAKLPVEEQANLVDKAMTMSVEEFQATAGQRIKELRDAKKTGVNAEPIKFEPVAYRRKDAEIQLLADTTKAIADLITESGSKTLEDAVRATVAWVFHLDPLGKAEQIAKHEQVVAEREQAKAKKAEEVAARKAEREAIKAKEAAAAHAAAQAKLVAP